MQVLRDSALFLFIADPIFFNYQEACTRASSRAQTKIKKDLLLQNKAKVGGNSINVIPLPIKFCSGNLFGNIKRGNVFLLVGKLHFNGMFFGFRVQ